MSKFKKHLIRFIKEEDAPTMVEYGLLVALIALVVAVGAAALGLAIDQLFDDAAAQTVAPGGGGGGGGGG